VQCGGIETVPGERAEQDIDIAFAVAEDQRVLDVFGADQATQRFTLVFRLDDGEAKCFAIAKNHGWLLATDERPTENLAKKHSVPIITTPELVKHWADKTKASEEEVAKALWNIQTYAHYFPRKTLPMHSWWMDLVKKARTR